MKRPRRLRKNAAIRDLVANNFLSKNKFIYPLFVYKGQDNSRAIDAMPGISQWSIDGVVLEVAEAYKLGIRHFLLFGSDTTKDEHAHSATLHAGPVPTALRRLRAEFNNDIVLYTDVCLCAYTTTGHCGLGAHGHIDNDSSLGVLAKMALTHAEAGADFVAPSDMMDGRVAAIRSLLDEQGFSETGIMSYSVKYASSYYGPFREAAGSAPQHGDRKSYQMDIRNSHEALVESKLDEDEGADILMVKPALAFLDIIQLVKSNTDLPLACYNVSGEYSMVKAAAQRGWVDEANVVLENFYAFHRAGADIIISYHIKEALAKGWIQ